MKLNRVALTVRWTISGVYAVLLVVASLSPSSAFSRIPLIITEQDKVFHALMYGGWAMLLYWAYSGSFGRVGVRAWGSIVTVCTLFGGVMELLQGLLPMPRRTCSWEDALANLIGAVMGVGLMVFVRSRSCDCSVH